MTCFLLIEIIHDPRGERPIAVFASRVAAECAQLGEQQRRAADVNLTRRTQFATGQACGRVMSADDFASLYKIRTVGNEMEGAS